MAWIFKSLAPIPVCEFEPGWGDEALMGAHSIRAIFSCGGSDPDINKEIKDEPTRAVVIAILNACELDYRTLGYVTDAQPSYHEVDLRVGDLESYPTFINRAQDAWGGHRRRNKTMGKRLKNAPDRPFLISNGRGGVHLDGFSGDYEDSDMHYTMSNTDGTVSYEQRFLDLSLGLFASSHPKSKVRQASRTFFSENMFSPFYFGYQARPGRSKQNADNRLFRSASKSFVHRVPRRTDYLEGQRIFVRNIVSTSQYPR